ncbi:Mitochondrial carrier domain protein [Ascosphaera apis ARSEF 7405]|uniref:Mitochondrial carrier domain protein n=1 Tax=Ascosphaera apis ARSEF 7405 TaxID=392613 RepID=A0A168BBG3_9EURO|nr:Mitochondrial carrier domain protein [Ascosphaera apis ARSEF 7405]
MAQPQGQGPNPLRPYYVPPSIGLPSPSTSTSPSSASPANAISSDATGAVSGGRMNIGSSARDLLPDFDYADYLTDSSPTLSEGIKDLIDQAIYKYTSVLLVQPFDLAKTILQVYVPPDEEPSPWDDDRRGAAAGRGRRGRARGRVDEILSEDEYEDEEKTMYGNGGGGDNDITDSSDDEAEFFTSTQPHLSSHTSSPSRKVRSRPRITDRQGYIPPSPVSRNTLKMRNGASLMEVIGSLYSTYGAGAVWKGSTATFIYSLLSPTLNTFLRGLMSAILALPDDATSPIAEAESLLLSSSSPFTTLALTCISTALSALILSPIDTTRTYLMLTPAGHGPRSLIRAIKKLPSPYYMIPSHLITVTVFASTLPNLIANSAPILFRNYLSLDPYTNSSAWSLLTFMASGLELAVRYPLETVLRRAQIATYTSPALRQQNLPSLAQQQQQQQRQQYPRGSIPSVSGSQRGRGSIGENIPSSASDSASDLFQPVQTIVPTPLAYKGIISSMWSIVYEEGTSPVQPTQPPVQRRSVSADVDDRASEVQSQYSSTRTQFRRRKGQGVQGL